MDKKEQTVTVNFIINKDHHDQLFKLALDLSNQRGRRVSISELVRHAVTEFYFNKPNGDKHEHE